MTLEPDERRRLRIKTRTAITDLSIGASSCGLTEKPQHTTETAANHDDKRRRIKEPQTPLSSAFQNGVQPCVTDLEPSNGDKIASVLLP